MAIFKRSTFWKLSTIFCVDLHANALLQHFPPIYTTTLCTENEKKHKGINYPFLVTSDVRYSPNCHIGIPPQ